MVDLPATWQTGGMIGDLTKTKPNQKCFINISDLNLTPNITKVSTCSTKSMLYLSKAHSEFRRLKLTFKV